MFLYPEKWIHANFSHICNIYVNKTMSRNKTISSVIKQYHDTINYRELRAGVTY